MSQDSKSLVDRRGLILILSSPSGAGKTTLTRSLVEEQAGVLSVSVTTRPKRPSEIEGRHYHFIDVEEFKALRDRDELLASVALRGFQQFEAALTRAWDDSRPNPFAAFDRLGKAYLAFARSEPAYYSAMFEAGIPLDTSPDLAQAGDDAFAVLRRATDALIATMPASQRPPVGMMALHVWSLSHGVASLFARGDAGRRKLPMSAEELLEAGILVYLRGLGVAE